MALRSFAAIALLASSALARTDLEGCTSSNTVIKPTQGGTPYASVLWYVPGTGEICEFLDCGGGRAPPKTTVPGCPLYSGTATYSPRYISTAAQATPTPAASAAASSSSSSSSPASSATDAGAGVTSATASAQVTASPSQTSAPSSSSSAAASSGSDSAFASVSQTTQATEQTTITTAPAKPTLQPSSGTGKNSTATTTLVNGAVPVGASGLGSLVIAGVAAAAMMM